MDFNMKNLKIKKTLQSYFLKVKLQRYYLLKRINKYNEASYSFLYNSLKSPYLLIRPL